jgi:hypothetical protein
MDGPSPLRGINCAVHSSLIYPLGTVLGVECQLQTIPEHIINNCRETFLAHEIGRVRKRYSKHFYQSKSIYINHSLSYKLTPLHIISHKDGQPNYPTCYFASFPLSHNPTVLSRTHWRFVAHVSLYQAGVMAGSAAARFFVTIVGQAGIGNGLVFPSQKFSS